MSADRDETRIVGSWLEEGVTSLPDRVLDRVLDQVPATPQRRATWWPARRFPPMNQTMRIALASAAVVAVALIGISILGGQQIGGPNLDDPTPSPMPSIATQALLPDSGQLTPGTYVIDEPFTLRVSMTVGDGWNIWSGITPDGAAIYKESADPPNGRGVIVSVVNNLYADPCDTSAGLLDPPLGPSVEDLATALLEQPRTDASPITDVSLAGYSGKYVEYTATVAIDGCASTLHRWPTVAGPRLALVDEHDQVWILDVDGVRLVIDAFSFPGASEADLAEILEIVESIQIQP